MNAPTRKDGSANVPELPTRSNLIKLQEPASLLAEIELALNEYVDRLHGDATALASNREYGRADQKMQESSGVAAAFFKVRHIIERAGSGDGLTVRDQCSSKGQIKMSEANKETGVDDTASGCCHGGQQRTEVADRCHEPAQPATLEEMISDWMAADATMQSFFGVQAEKAPDNTA